MLLPLIASTLVTSFDCPTVTKMFLVPRNSTTFLSISKKGLPAPSTRKAHAKLVDPVDSNWVWKYFADFVIFKKQDDSGATIFEEEKIAMTYRSRCLHCSKLFSSRNTTHMKRHLVKPKTCSLVLGYSEATVASHAFAAQVVKHKHAVTDMFVTERSKYLSDVWVTIHMVS